MPEKVELEHRGEIEAIRAATRSNRVAKHVDFEIGAERGGEWDNESQRKVDGGP